MSNNALPHFLLDFSIGLRFQLRPNTIVNSKDGIDFAMSFTLWASLFELRPNTSGTPEDFRFCVVKGSK